MMQAISASTPQRRRSPGLTLGALALAGVIGALAPVPAQADPDGWRGDRDRGECREHAPPGWCKHERPVYVAPYVAPRYYYAPPPAVVYAPPPPVYYAPPPVVYTPPPPALLNLGVTFR